MVLLATTPDLLAVENRDRRTFLMATWMENRQGPDTVDLALRFRIRSAGFAFC